MKLRKSSTSNFRPSYKRNHKSIEGIWNLDNKSLSNCGGKVQEFSSVKPSGKGRFGKLTISYPIDRGGSHNLHSNSNDGNSNDSGVGIDLHSSESHSQNSQWSWCSEDSYLGSFPISNVSIPQFPRSERSSELFNTSVNGRSSSVHVNFSNQMPSLGGSSFDTNSAKLLLPEKAQLVPVADNIQMSPDSTETSFQLLEPRESINSNSSLQSVNSSASSNSPTSSTMSPVPIKRSRFTYASQNGSLSSGKGGLKLRTQNQNSNGRNGGNGGLGSRLPPGTTPTLTSSLASTSRDGRVQLQIVSQPEEQHRARYQTEGSRGAIKDRKGNGFPTVKLVGYDKPATLQIFIGTDQGKVSPHMFYQACKVTGKSSTPCIEKKVEGTIVIEIEFEPSKDSVISCDCVGILKERNVDVEQRFPFHHASQSRKKSTKCRMIYRTTIINSNGMEETLQVSSLPILCTQPPGLPEICKQSLFECPAKGGLELFVIGKNFLKDTEVIFAEEDNDGNTLWEATSEPLKDYLQQNHLICVVPPYKDQNVEVPVECKVIITSGGKQSEPHRFAYLPNLPPVVYGGIPRPSSSQPTQQQQLQTQDRVMRNLSGGDHTSSMMMDIQVLEPLVPPNETSQITSAMDVLTSSVPAVTSSLSAVVGSICQSSLPTNIQSVGERTGAVPASTLDQMTGLSFSSNIITSPTTAHERQVVNELQCILDQSVQQNQQHQKVANDIMSTANNITIMSTKSSDSSNSNSNTSSNFDGANLSSIVVPSSVPLDLQFPTDNIHQVTSVSSGVSFSEAISNPQSYSNSSVQQTVQTVVQNMNSMSPVMSRSSSMDHSMEMNAEQKLLTELLPGSAEMLVSVPNTNTMSLSVPDLSVASCIQPGTNGTMIKAEPGSNLISSVSSTVNGNSIAIATSNILSHNIQGQQHQQPGLNSMVNSMGNSGGVVFNNVVGDLQGHQGNITNAITQMSDNELINYINPSCFEHNLM